MEISSLRYGGCAAEVLSHRFQQISVLDRAAESGAACLPLPSLSSLLFWTDLKLSLMRYSVVHRGLDADKLPCFLFDPTYVASGTKLAVILLTGNPSGRLQK